MDIKWLKTFIVAAETENFRKTSEILFVSQPTVTIHIKHLEELLGVTLFEKRGRNIFLTSAGHRFLPHARKIVKSYNVGIEDLENWKQGYCRKLNIAVAPHIASSILPIFLRKFLKHAKDLEVIIDVMKSMDIGQAVSTGMADIGLSRMMPIQKTLTCDSLFDDPVVLVAPNLEHEGIQSEAAVLTKYRLLTHNHPEYWDDLLLDLRNIYPNIRAMIVNQVDITKKFIEEGLGVSFLPSSIVQDEIKQGKMIEIKSQITNPPFSSTYAITKIKSPDSDRFIHSLSQFLRNQSGSK